MKRHCEHAERWSKGQHWPTLTMQHFNLNLHGEQQKEIKPLKKTYRRHFHADRRPFVFFPVFFFLSLLRVTQPRLTNSPGMALRAWLWKNTLHDRCAYIRKIKSSFVCIFQSKDSVYTKRARSLFLSLAIYFCSHGHAFSFTLSALCVCVCVLCQFVCDVHRVVVVAMVAVLIFPMFAFRFFVLTPTMYYMLCVCTKARRTFLICSIS